MKRRAFARFAGVASLLGGSLVFGCSSKSTPDPGPCVADPFEPNDGPTARAAFGTLQDDDDVSISGSDDKPAPNKLRRALTTHAAGDVDWFDVEVRDTGIGGNPGLSVIVSEGYEVTAWWVCANRKTESVVCGYGSPVENDPELEGAKGCLSKVGSAGPPQLSMQIECADTSSDDGTLTLRVKRLVPSAACERYSLTVGAD